MAEQTITRFLDGIGRDVEARLDAAAEHVVEVAREVWPSEQHPENIYATGASNRRWVILNAGPYRRDVVNEAEYSLYADEGYTRWKGKASANPWAQRGSRDYTDQIAEKAAPGVARILMEGISNG